MQKVSRIRIIKKNIIIFNIVGFYSQISYNGVNYNLILGITKTIGSKRSNRQETGGRNIDISME